MATSGYDIAKLEKQQQALKLENESLQIEASKLQSIQNIDSGVATSGMVPVSENKLCSKQYERCCKYQ